jgi:sugar lactone lactonase YvrE
MKQVASSGGFSQGMAFDAEDDLHVCDLKHSAVMRLDARSGPLEKFADSVNGRGMKISTFLAFNSEGRLYVSDSHAFKEPGPGNFHFNPDGSGELWYDEPINFANGLALTADGRHLYVAETFGNAVFRVAIEDDGSAGIREEVAPSLGYCRTDWPSMPQATYTWRVTSRVRCYSSPPRGGVALHRRRGGIPLLSAHKPGLPRQHPLHDKSGALAHNGRRDEHGRVTSLGRLRQWAVSRAGGAPDTFGAA